LYRRILTTSIRVNQAFGRSGFFIEELKAKLEKYANSNNIRISLLRILALIFYASQQPAKMIEYVPTPLLLLLFHSLMIIVCTVNTCCNRDHKLMPVLERLSKDTGAVVVQDLARKLITKVQSQLSNGTGTAPAPTAAGAAAAALLGSPPPAAATATTTTGATSSSSAGGVKPAVTTTTTTGGSGVAAKTTPASPSPLIPAGSSLGLGLSLSTTSTVTPTRQRKLLHPPTSAISISINLLTRAYDDNE
jgi:hypothetical protein